MIGLTGNIASGKSAVVAVLQTLGAAVIDGDAVYHELIQPGRPVWKAVRERFGPGVVDTDRQIDRKALGRIVFSDPAALADLDAITHPEVVTEIRDRLAKSDDAVVVVEAVKLIESGMTADCDEIWVVTSQPEQQVERLMTRNGLSRPDAEQHVGAQPPLRLKLQLADVIIDNSGTLDETRRQVENYWRARGHATRGVANQ